MRQWKEQGKLIPSIELQKARKLLEQFQSQMPPGSRVEVPQNDTEFHAIEPYHFMTARNVPPPPNTYLPHHIRTTGLAPSKSISTASTDSDGPVTPDALVDSPLAFNSYGLNSDEIGMDFILGLERACSVEQSIDSNPELFLAGNYVEKDHVAPVLFMEPEETSVLVNKQGTATATENGHPIDLSHLLTLSKQIDLEGFVTPIQVWYELSTHPSFANMTSESLNALQAALYPAVKSLG